MKQKKLVSIFLAAVLALALAVPAFAADATSDITTATGNLTVGGETKAPTIKVRIPTTDFAKVILNPYQMTVEANATIGSVKGDAQVISGTYYAVNLTDAKVKVTMKVKGATANNLVYSDKLVSTKKDATANEVFLYMDTKVVSKDKEKVTWSGTYDKANTMQAMITSAATPSEIKVDKNTHVVLEAAKDANTAGTGGVLAFTFGGDANGNPTRAWVAADKPTITVSFSFAVTSDPSTYSAQQAAG